MYIDWHYTFLCAAMALLSLSSCVKDDMDDCPASKVSIQFNYTYNLKDADAFSTRVRNVNVYVFDGNGKYLMKQCQSAEQFAADYTMDFTGLEPGKYTFACMARGKQESEITNTDKEFLFSQLTRAASGVDDLNASINAPVNDYEFTPLFSGHTTVEYNGRSITDTICLKKWTNRYRVVLIPYSSNMDGFDVENFDVRITGIANTLDINGKSVGTGNIIYTPYRSTLITNESNEANVNGQPVDKALVYDLKSSRLFENHPEQRIIITDKRTGRELFNHSLPWLMALYNGSLRNLQWGDQEYLDRQDNYFLTFYVANPSTDFYLSAKVKINDWVVNLQEVGLK